MKLGAGFFGWLTATGMAVILLALFTAAGAAASSATGTGAGEAANQAAPDASSTGIAGGAALVVLLIAYCCGGHVAGRMARFDGVEQGIAVWLTPTGGRTSLHSLHRTRVLTSRPSHRLVRLLTCGITDRWSPATQGGCPGPLIPNP